MLNTKYRGREVMLNRIPGEAMLIQSTGGGFVKYRVPGEAMLNTEYRGRSWDKFRRKKYPFQEGSCVN